MDIIVPMARVIDLVICEDQVPYDLKGDVCGALQRKQVEEYAYAMGRTAMPKKPLLLFGPDEYMPILIMGDGVTEAAEIQDLALEALDRQEESIKKNGRGMNFAEARERAGMVRREDFDAAFRDALERNTKRRKANWRTEGK